MVFWRTRLRAGRRGPTADDVRPEGVVADRAPHQGEQQPDDGQQLPAVIDRSGWAARIEPDLVRAAELAERFRFRTARVEAQRDLERLRARHWSGERILDEGRTTIDWWEHSDADPYAVLGLLPGAQLDEAAAARRRVAQVCHPDRLAPGEDRDAALRRMVAANSAYDRLRRALQPIR